MKDNNKDIRYYIYIDKEGIDSIYRQYPDAEKVVKETIVNYMDGEYEGQIGANKFLQPFISLNVKASTKSNYEEKHEYTYDIPYEFKVKFIHQKINGGINDDLSDILYKTPQINRLVACKAIFRLENAFDEEKSEYILPSEIAKYPYSYKKLLFNFCSSPSSTAISSINNLFDANCVNKKYYVDMCFSSSKMIRGVRHLTNCIKYSKDFLFYLIGEISYEAEQIYCLKPYAIWRKNDI